MKAEKRSLTTCLCLLVLVCACTAGTSGMSPRNARWSVAVLDYEDLSPLDATHLDLAELLTAKAIETIEKDGRFDVVERKRLATVLEELNLGTSIVADRQSQLELGQITGARLMVFGCYQVIEGQLRLDVRLVNVESGRVINSVSLVAAEPGLDGWLDAVAKTTAALFRQ